MAKYSQNYNLILPEAEDYYDVAVFNENFKVVDDIVATTGNEKIVVASYDTKSVRKSRADYVCTADNAVSVLQTAINGMSEGDELYIMDGTYNITSAVVVNKAITIRGAGMAHTIFVKAENSYTGAVLDIQAGNVTVKSLMLLEGNQTSARDIVLINGENIILRDIFFVQRGANLSNSNIVRTTGACNYSRIDACRVFREYSEPDIIMFNLSGYDFSGSVLGNILSGNDNLSVGFNNSESRKYTVISGNNSTDIYVNNVKE